MQPYCVYADQPCLKKWASEQAPTPAFWQDLLKSNCAYSGDENGSPLDVADLMQAIPQNALGNCLLWQQAGPWHQRPTPFFGSQQGWRQCRDHLAVESGRCRSREVTS